jgi:glycerophosphoryl diester phosphodiesterase
MAYLHALTVTLAMTTTAWSGEGPVEYIAHRGESADAPENTMPAFDLAWRRGVKAIELDAHLSRDGVLVVCHDADTRRTTGVDLKIKETDWKDLKDLDAGRWKGEKFAGTTMPRIEEALASIPEGARCFIEIKVGPESIPALVKAVRSSGKKPEQLCVISFNADTVAESKKQLPELKAYYLAGFRHDKETGAFTPTLDELIARARKINADGLDLAHNGPIDRAFVERVKSEGLGMFVWTIDDPAIARRMIEAGVDGITTNKAEWLAEQVR